MTNVYAARCFVVCPYCAGVFKTGVLKNPVAERDEGQRLSVVYDCPLCNAQVRVFLNPTGEAKEVK